MDTWFTGGPQRIIEVNIRPLAEPPGVGEADDDWGRENQVHCSSGCIFLSSPGAFSGYVHNFPLPVLLTHTNTGVIWRKFQHSTSMPSDGWFVESRRKIKRKFFIHTRTRKTRQHGGDIINTLTAVWTMLLFLTPLQEQWPPYQWRVLG